MGVGFSLIAKKPPRRFFGVFSRETDWKVVIESAIEEVARGLGVDFLIPPSVPAGVGQVAAHYCEEWLDLEVNDDSVVLMGRTSTCGPGYHAFMIDVVDYLSRVHNLQFRENEEHFDETEYFRNRDFVALQRYHANWLTNLANMIVEQSSGGESFQMVSMPIGRVSPISRDASIATPLGFLTLEDFVRLAEGEGVRQMELAESWFPWWSRSPSAGDYVATARNLMWVEVPWHAPVTADEKHVVAAALTSCERAKMSDPAIDVPIEELSELNSLMTQSAGEARKPSEQGIGYRRRTCSWQFGGGWSMRAPGYWYESVENNFDHLTFGTETIIVSTYSVEKKPGSEPDSKELIPLEDDVSTVFEFSEGAMQARLTLQKAPPGSGIYLYALQAAAPERRCLVTFEGKDPDFENTIPEIARSLRSIAS